LPVAAHRCRSRLHRKTTNRGEADATRRPGRRLAAPPNPEASLVHERTKSHWFLSEVRVHLASGRAAQAVERGQGNGGGVLPRNCPRCRREFGHGHTERVHQVRLPVDSPHRGGAPPAGAVRPAGPGRDARGPSGCGRRAGEAAAERHPEDPRQNVGPHRAAGIRPVAGRRDLGEGSV